SRPDRTFRIAHSATVRTYKGTAVLIRVCDALRAKGLPIELVLIEGMEHGAALRLKATCDATFDSFWLGLQGSGLEAAAMGQPVIAGDANVRALYEQRIGFCPYTFAPDEEALGAAIERLATDPAFYASEARRVAEYTTVYHDYAAVAARYESILSKWL